MSKFSGPSGHLPSAPSAPDLSLFLSAAVAYSRPQSHIFKIQYNYLWEIIMRSLLGAKAIK